MQRRTEVPYSNFLMSNSFSAQVTHLILRRVDGQRCFKKMLNKLGADLRPSGRSLSKIMINTVNNETYPLSELAVDLHVEGEKCIREDF